MYVHEDIGKLFLSAICPPPPGILLPLPTSQILPSVEKVDLEVDSLSLDNLDVDKVKT